MATTIDEHKMSKRSRKRLVSCIKNYSFEFDRLTFLFGSAEADDESVDGRSGPRNKLQRPDYENSTWGIMLNDPDLEDPASVKFRLFTRRFRMPYPVFKYLCELTKKWNTTVNKQKQFDCTNRRAIPLELKVLGCLRMLSRGTCLDGIKELSGISESSMCIFFHKWCKWIRKEIFPKFVNAPSTKEQISAAMGPYCALGLNGAIGSTDAVHIHWDKCPKELTTIHTGKEGYFINFNMFTISSSYHMHDRYPTVAYNCTCAHDGSIINVTNGAYGSCNDKTLVRFDGFIDDIRTQPVYTDITYELMVPNKFIIISSP